MEPETPPFLVQPPRASTNERTKLVVTLVLIPACVIGALIVLRIVGLLWPFNVPTGAMTPAVSAGDHVVMEGMTFLARKPRRGDIVVFRTDGIGSLPPTQFYVKRIAGEPGDHLRILDGKVFINDKQVSLSNAAGEIAYYPPRAMTIPPKTDLTVPDGCYFVLGDNSTNSFDSHYWGSVPRGNIIGRISFCYWPLQRVGGVK